MARLKEVTYNCEADDADSITVFRLGLDLDGPLVCEISAFHQKWEMEPQWVGGVNLGKKQMKKLIDDLTRMYEEICEDEEDRATVG